MRIKWIVVLLVILGMLPGWAGAASENDFEANTTEQMLRLCTADPSDPLHAQAVNFCHGYLVGAYNYYRALHSGPEAMRLVCMPDPAPSRNEAIGMFIDWAKARPQFWKEPPVESEFRFLTEKWPCK